MVALELINASLYTGREVIRNGRMRIDGTGAIAALCPMEADIADQAAARTIDAAGCTVIPGLIDVHVHGGGGWDLLRGEEADFAGTARFHATYGTTAFLATTGPDREAYTQSTLRNARSASRKRWTDGAELIGVHLEGPFLNPKRKGAMDETMLRPPDLRELERYMEAAGGLVRLVTAAPELEGAEAFIRRAAEAGIRVSAGHSDATFEQMEEAVRWGVTHTTHHFNGMSPLHHRAPGVAGAGLLLPELTTELIADGIHVHPAVVRLLYAMKGEWGVCAVTDAVACTGMPDGDYGGSTVRGGHIYVKGTDTLAGSSLTMLRALRNTMLYTGRPLERVLPSFTAVPARVAGVDRRKGLLRVGFDADFVILDRSFEVAATYVRGQKVYAAQDKS